MTNEAKDGGDASVVEMDDAGFRARYRLSGRRESSQRHVESTCLAFRDLSFEVNDRKTRKPLKLLEGVCGRVDRARTLAVIGPSGAGKTTLMSLLTLRAPAGVATGSASLGGRPLTHSLFRRQCFFVTQQDELWPTLSPREQLDYARLLFSSAGADMEASRVDEVLRRMGLESCADTVVGVDIVPGGLSGGQKRRLSVAIALMKRALCVFLDEPTSGLDAASAFHTMAFVRELAVTEALIAVATIHQPSTRVYLCFDECMLLSSGRCAFLGEASHATAHFEALGHALPELTNPADFMLDLVNADFVDRVEVDRLLDAWDDDDEISAFLPDDTGTDTGIAILPLDDVWGTRPTLRSQLRILLERQVVLLSRDVLVVASS